MQSFQSTKRGGRRVGAGRPKGSGHYGEPTVTMRVPLSAADDVRHLIETGKTRLDLVDMSKINEKKHEWVAGIF